MAINNVVDQAQICFSATLSANTAAVTGDATLYTLICDTVIVNRGLNYDNTTGLFTVAKAGNYVLGYCVNYLAIAGGAQYFVVTITDGTSKYAYQTWPTFNKCANFHGPNNWVSASTVQIVPLTLGQTVSVSIVGTGGAKNDIVAGTVGSSQPTMFYGYLIN